MGDATVTTVRSDDPLGLSSISERADFHEGAFVTGVVGGRGAVGFLCGCLGFRLGALDASFFHQGPPRVQPVTQATLPPFKGLCGSTGACLMSNVCNSERTSNHPVVGQKIVHDSLSSVLSWVEDSDVLFSLVASALFSSPSSTTHNCSK